MSITVTGVCQKSFILGRLLLQPVVGELGHVSFDADQTVAEVAVVQFSDLAVNPLQQIRHQLLVIVLHLLQIH